jgi:4-hydroxy-tetrahydrodipicolinate synthase
MRRLMDTEDAQLNEQLRSLMSWLFCEPNPIPLNTALAMTGAAAPIFRLPYVPLDLQRRRIGLEILQGFDEKDWVGDKLELFDDDCVIFI